MLFSMFLPFLDIKIESQSFKIYPDGNVRSFLARFSIRGNQPVIVNWDRVNSVKL